MRRIGVEDGRAEDGRVEDGAWWRYVRWLLPVGPVDLWRTQDPSQWEGPVRVSGAVPEAVCALEPFHWTRWSNGGRTDAERQLVDGLPIEVEGHEVAIRMPERGWSRDRRRLYVEVDGQRYTARPRAWASTQLVRADGTPIWRSYFLGPHRLADDVSPVETTIAALCTVLDVHSRLVHNPLNLV